MEFQIHRLNFESSRKTSEPDMGGSGLIHRSIDCLASQMETSSDSDLLRSTTAPWQRERFQLPVSIMVKITLIGTYG